MDKVFHVDIEFIKLALQTWVSKTRFLFNVFIKLPPKTEFQKHGFDHLKPEICTLRHSALLNSLTHFETFKITHSHTQISHSNSFLSQYCSYWPTVPKVLSLSLSLSFSNFRCWNFMMLPILFFNFGSF